MKKFYQITAWVLLGFILSACEKQPEAPLNNQLPSEGASIPPGQQAGDQASSQLQSAKDLDGVKVRIANPEPFNPIEDSDLGMNEEGKGLELGNLVTPVTIKDMAGSPYALEQSWAEKPALIIFYRGGWCPYCNAQVRELSVNYDKLSEAGVQPVLISVDAPDRAAMLNAQYKIPFPVLSDPELKAHEAFNVVLEVDATTLAKLKDYGINLSDWSGFEHKKMAVASVFLIDKSGRVLFSHAPKDYRARPSLDQLLAVVNTHFPKDPPPELE